MAVKNVRKLSHVSASGASQPHISQMSNQGVKNRRIWVTKKAILKYNDNSGEKF